MTTISGILAYLRSHILQMTSADLAVDTIGAIRVLVPFTNSGRDTGRPAPEMIRSAPAFTASFT